MNDLRLSDKQIEQIKGFQKNEITEYHIYSRLARNTKNKENRKVLEKIASEELPEGPFTGVPFLISDLLADG